MLHTHQNVQKSMSRYSWHSSMIAFAKGTHNITNASNQIRLLILYNIMHMLSHAPLVILTNICEYMKCNVVLYLVRRRLKRCAHTHTQKRRVQGHKQHPICKVQSFDFLKEQFEWVWFHVIVHVPLWQHRMHVLNIL